jgi:hypothetical protein
MPKPKKPRRRKDTLLYMSALQMMEGLSLIEEQGEYLDKQLSTIKLVRPSGREDLGEMAGTAGSRKLVLLAPQLLHSRCYALALGRVGVACHVSRST